MRPKPWLSVGVTLTVVAVCGGQDVAVEDQDAKVATIIRQAGNADEDAQRLRFLKQLQAAGGLSADRKSDVDTMVAAIERWMDHGNLPYFGGEAARTIDFDFHIARDSPLYPITCLYRGRMLTWVTLESGNIMRYPDRRRKFLDRAVENFRVARDAFPNNRVAGMYLGEPIPWPKELNVPDGAPAWAVDARENLERLTDIIVWWIDHRMQPDGQYGGGWGDDCEMWRWWTPVLIGFEDSKITAAQARFSQALLNQPHMKGGYTSRMTDVEHTAEDSADAITPMMHLEPENAEWKRRALRLVELMKDRWTGRNQRGFLQFKSTYFTADRVDDRSDRACDTVYHPRAMQPALLLWQRTGDAELSALFSAWMDTWVDAAARAERGKPAGIVPSAIHWPEGRIGGAGEHWWDPRNHGEPTLYEWPSALSMLNDTLLLTHHMTGDPKYLQPLRSMAAIRLNYLKQKPMTSPPAGSQAWCASRLGLLAGTLAKYRALTGSTEFDELLARDGGGSLSLNSSDGRAWAVQRLRHSTEALRINFEGYTSEVRWTDRVLRFPALFGPNMMFREPVSGIQSPDPGLLYSITTGDPGNPGYFAMNAVRWLTPPRDIAAMVTDSGQDRFAAELYHFGPTSRPMSAELYLLAPGRYTLTVSDLAEHHATRWSKTVSIEGPRTRISFDLPPQRLVAVSLEQE